MPGQKVVVLTGAGISAESGIPTFRASDGLWHEHRIEEVATPQAFARQPALVQQFYNQRRRHLLSADITPNAAHTALAALEQRKVAGDVLVVTQNIDDLHERAGSQQLIHMHGELLKMRCTRSAEVFDIRDDIEPFDLCRCCALTHTLRPHVVWFGEMPLQMPAIEAALQVCDVFVSIGTSGHVYPAAGFVELAHRAGAQTIEINLQPSARQSAFADVRQGPASRLVPELVAQLLGDSPAPA